MPNMTQTRDRRTSVDVVFDHLYDEISSLKLLPGDKISEADIAAQFGVSRQPVRDAFSRLENLDLLLIRPQRATEVKRFSSREITKSRFVRAAVESEVLRRAAKECDPIGAAQLDAALTLQAATVAAGDYDKFGAQDYAFHQTLCEIAKAEFAFEVIQQEKARVDRLCVLSLSKENRMTQLLKDHETIAARVKEHDAEGAVAAGMQHLSRLDDTITAISNANEDYFDP
ncbi:GntR family transcriptional regulator [Yoonia sp. BS5-3]|uniref:GntR family transcriptional regulator n=1 Tax=Yoonia phaeophyticola TaxID=3137369 RepID=A0ABZ2V4U6_9RHOB